MKSTAKRTTTFQAKKIGKVIALKDHTVTNLDTAHQWSTSRPNHFTPPPVRT